ncbi:MAG: DUF973 family protein [Ignisphaera sp.]
MGSPQSSVSTESKSIAIEGLRKLRTGAIIFIVATLLMVGALITAIPTILAAGFGGGAIGAFMGLATILGVAIVGFILNLVGLFGFVIPGTSKLAEWDEKFSTSSKLLKIGYGGGAVLMLIAIIIILVAAFTYSLGAFFGGLALVVIGGIMLLVGYIGLIILSFKLNDTFSVTSIMVAGILFIIGIFVGVLQFIAWILMYVGLGSAIEKLEKGEM